MRKFIVAAISAAVLTAVAASPAAASPRVDKVSLTAKITSFRATAAGVVGDGLLTGTLHSGSTVTRASAPAKFSVVSRGGGGRCNVLNLRLAPVDLELLGVEVKTSYISLNVFAEPGRVLGDLFCGLAHAKIVFPRAAAVASALNSRLHGRPLRVLAASDTVSAQPQSCQVLKLVLGPLHLDLLGLVVNLYGYSPVYPVKVFIYANPTEGLLGQLLCSLAGGTGISSIGSLQNLLSGLGVSLSTTQVQNLLNQLGITDLAAGLTQGQLNSILQALGLGSSMPSG